MQDVIDVAPDRNTALGRLRCFMQAGRHEDSEGEETYNYGEDEGEDRKREMSMEDRIDAIKDHLDHLKKDMGYDEDHEDRDEKGTDFE